MVTFICKPSCQAPQGPRCLPRPWSIGVVNIVGMGNRGSEPITDRAQCSALSRLILTRTPSHSDPKRPSTFGRAWTWSWEQINVGYSIRKPARHRQSGRRASCPALWCLGHWYRFSEHTGYVKQRCKIVEQVRSLAAMRQRSASYATDIVAVGLNAYRVNSPGNITLK
jgi:hypothetical protein